MILKPDFLRACRRVRRAAPEVAYGGLSLGIGLGLSHLQGRAGGVAPSYPTAVVSAGAQVAWDQRAITGWRVPPTKVVGVDPLDTTAWDDNGSRLQSKKINATLEGWDTNGRYINLIHNGW